LSLYKGDLALQLVTYQSTTGPRVGRQIDQQIFDLGYQEMTEFLALPDWRERAKAATSGQSVPLKEARLLAPVRRPAKLVCIGLNYSDHAAETGGTVPKEPILFGKYANAVIGPGEGIPHPGTDVTNKMDWEVELAIVIGKTCRRVSEADALGYVAGYTVINDVSARDLQLFDGQWMKGKALDGFAPMGPCITTTDEITDPQNLRLTMHVNGTKMQDGNTNKMIFSAAHIVHYLSRLMTLEPGDVIATGTPPGVGMAKKPAIWLKVGDVCRAEIEGIGVIENRVVAI